MNSRFRSTLAAFAIVAVAAWIVACENSGVTAPSDSALVVTVNPGTVNIDPNANQTQASADLRAELYSSKGSPLQGVPVVFVTQAGKLASGGASQNTDASGVVTDTITVSSNDPETIEITARASSVSSKTTLKKSVGQANKPPQAVIVAVPTNQQVANKPVIFDGTSSLDQDGNTLTMFRWEILSDKPDTGKTNPLVVEGPTDSALTLTFQNLQTLSVTLKVSDDPQAALDFARNIPVSYSALQAVLPYKILCGLPPTAVIAGPDTVNVSNAPGQQASVLLDGTLSTDADGLLDKYTWSCGNGTQPIPQGNGSKVVCSYKVESVQKTYSATLVVTDNGSGVIDPNTGTYFCAQQSKEDSVLVIVSPLQ